MLTFLEQIFHGILSLPYLIINVLIQSINGLIVLIATVVNLVIGLLPGLPTRPEVPYEIASAVSWFFPFGLLIPTFVIALGAYALYLAIKVTLNWFKVTL